MNKLMFKKNINVARHKMQKNFKTNKCDTTPSVNKLKLRKNYIWDKSKVLTNLKILENLNYDKIKLWTNLIFTKLK